MKYLLALVLVFLAGCSDYHPLRDGVGFTEIPIGSDQFQVTYRGDADMSAPQARLFALTRASELAALRGMPYFEIENERTYLLPGADYQPGYYDSYYDGYPGRFGRERVYRVRTYTPGYIDYYTIPDVWMQVRLLPGSSEKAIPAGYLLRQAQSNNVPLSPGVADLIPSLPANAVTIPPGPAPAPLVQRVPVPAQAAPPPSGARFAPIGPPPATGPAPSAVTLPPVPSNAPLPPPNPNN